MLDKIIKPLSYSTATLDSLITIYNVNQLGMPFEGNPLIRMLGNNMSNEMAIIFPKLIALGVLSGYEYLYNNNPLSNTISPNKLYGLSAIIWGTGALANMLVRYL